MGVKLMPDAKLATNTAWSTATPSDNDNPATMRKSRSDVRKQVPFDVLVSFGLTHSVPWHILDLGQGGAFVKMDTVGLYLGAHIDFILRFKKERRLVEHTLGAKVLRIEPRGVALQFERIDPGAHSDLTDLVYSL